VGHIGMLTRGGPVTWQANAMGKPKKRAPDDEMRRKFRAALDRKQHRDAEGNPSAPAEDKKAHDPHGTSEAVSSRTFRRKTGG